MRKIIIKVFVIIFLTLLAKSSIALAREDIADRKKPVWSDFPITLVYQFRVNIPFGQLNRYLCILNRTEYSRFANLQKNDDLAAHAYLTKLDQSKCGYALADNAELVRATQTTPDAAATIEYWKGITNSEVRALYLKAVVAEEANDSNPFGIIALDAEFFEKANPSKMLLRWRSESSRMGDGSIQYKVVEWLDSNVIDQSKSPGLSEEYYAVNIIYKEEDSGYGTIIDKLFNPAISGSGLYPEGMPAISGATNIAFDENFIKFEYYSDAYFSNTQVRSNQKIYESCISRKNPWQYVPQWGYGVYNASGDRNTENFDATYQDANGDLVSIRVVGFQAQPPESCRSLFDGSIVDKPIHSPECRSQAYPGPATLPSLDIPDLTTITSNFGEQYIVRQLRPRIVYPEVDMENCNSLTLRAPLVVENHSFFEGHNLDAELPTAGAVLVNEFSEEQERDPLYSGVSYHPLEDDDNDGVLNFLDAFPNDPERSADEDFDGIDDIEDALSNRYRFDHSRFIIPNAIEQITPSMGQP